MSLVLFYEPALAGRLPWGFERCGLPFVAIWQQLVQTSLLATGLLKRTFHGFLSRQGADRFLVGGAARENPMPAERFDFINAQGQRLAALLDMPAGEPRAYALFAHCFTCGKDVHAARRIAQALTALDIAVLRFDFTG